jgi:hypothetical protein
VRFVCSRPRPALAISNSFRSSEAATRVGRRLAVIEEPQIIWLCPMCRKPVQGHRAYVAALEGEYQGGVEHTDDQVWLRPVRFHQGHFMPRIRGKIYLREDDRDVREAEPAASVIDVIRKAYEALGQGELEPLAALMDDDVEWSGRRSGVRFWRPPPS